MPITGMEQLTVLSSLDGSQEPSLFYCPRERIRPPLLVGLHTWSCDLYNQVDAMLPMCRERGWALLLPEFRGPNLASNPRARQACASALAKQDIIDVVDVTLGEYALDADRVFLLGGSGGGHMALMMAAYAPRRWGGVSAWVPVTDLAAWHTENPSYAPHIAACCGGAPGTSPDVDKEYRERSPLHHAESMAEANLSVHHGRYDPSVPYSHTWRLAEELERLGARRCFYEVFDGGHEIRYDVAFQWFDRLAETKDSTSTPLTA
jgi:dipeptidyl aminopeptidase/acylaminoacyl peptidase